MRVRSLPPMLIGLMLVAACGGGGEDAVDRSSTHTDLDTRAAAADTAAAEAPTLQAAGYLRSHDEAGFEIFWPSGCGKINEQISSGATRSAAREFIYTCDQEGEEGRGASVHVMLEAHDRDGDPPRPSLVVSMVERRLQKLGVRPERQRPLRDENAEGVDVQAVEPDGVGEVWIRGLLMGDDIYLLAAWNREGDLFEDPETTDFFYSFRVDQP